SKRDWSSDVCSSDLSDVRTSPTSRNSVQGGDCITPQRRYVARVPIRHDVRRLKRLLFVKAEDRPSTATSLATSLDCTRHNASPLVCGQREQLDLFTRGREMRE